MKKKVAINIVLFWLQKDSVSLNWIYWSLWALSGPTHYPHLTEEELDPDILEDHELDELAVKLNQELDDLEHGTDYEDYQANADADVDDNADANDALKGSYWLR